MNLDKFYNKLWGIKESLKSDLKKLGDKLQFITPMAFIVYCACFVPDVYLARVFVCTFILGLVLMALIKACFNNPRPSEVEGTDNPDLELDWSPTEGQSFISGHSLSAILGGIFWFEIGTTWGIIGLTLGLLTGLTRIIAKAHWLRDVIGAGVLSTILYLIAHYYFLV